MAAKSEYQMVNRGRPGRPFWYVEKDGSSVFCDRRRSVAEGHMKMLRQLTRDRKKMLADGYHAPGMKP